MAKRSSKHAQTTWKGLKIRLLECPIEVDLLILWVLAWQIFEQLAIFPGLNRVLEMGPHEGRVEMDSLLLCCHLSVDAAQDNVGPLGCKCALLAHDISCIYQVFLGRVSLKEFFYSLYAYLGFPWLWWNTLLLALLTLIRFMYAHFSSLSKSIWVVSFPFCRNQLHHSSGCLQNFWECTQSHCPSHLYRLVHIQSLEVISDLLCSDFAAPTPI